MSARLSRRLIPPALLVLALILVVLLSGSVGKSSAQPTVLTVDPTQPGREFAPGAIGISLETEELDSKDLSASHKSLVAFMRRLGPGVLRLGGGSLDSSWWTSGGEQPPPWATNVVTPTDLVMLRRLLVLTGWRAMLGVDLGHFDPARAANEAQMAERILGSRLLGFEIGNEPDKFSSPVVKLRPPSYSLSSYLQEVAEYSVAMLSTSPGLRLYGPDLSSRSSWLPAIASDKNISFDGITLHYYPTSYSIPKGACKGTPTPTALELLSPQARERESAVLQSLVGAGQLTGREVRISETNTTSSCDYHGGPETSPVFASALWSLDWILRAASAGVAGLNFHGDFGHCAPDTFSPVCTPNNRVTASGEVAARPEYYGLLAARELEGGRFVPVEISGSSVAEDFTVYATAHTHGVITLAIDNFVSQGSTVLVVKVPGYRTATAQRLVGPSLGATSGVTFGRASFSAAGALRSKRTRISVRRGAISLQMAPDSAIVITLRR